MSLEKNLKRIRMEKKLTQPQLADKAGIHSSYIALIEKGYRKNPTIDILSSIADALEVNIEDLLKKENTDDLENVTSENK